MYNPGKKLVDFFNFYMSPPSPLHNVAIYALYVGKLLYLFNLFWVKGGLSIQGQSVSFLGKMYDYGIYNRFLVKLTKSLQIFFPRL